MKYILLSGGSGKRLWPLSNDSRSKQFLKLLSDNGGHQYSMLQRVWKQLGKANLTDSTMIITGRTQVDSILSQLESTVNYIIEPSRRDTFPAIVLATSYLYSCQGVDPNEVIVVLPVDSYVEDEFYGELKKFDDVMNTSGTEVALIGVEPTHLSTKYGYIVPDQDVKNKHYLRVERFEEKPTLSRASELVELGALWNCGIFSFRVGYILDKLKQMELPTEYQELKQNYERLPKISFDYQILEKKSNIVVIKYQGLWKDLGTWDALTEVMSQNILGEGSMSESSINTHIINELDIPILALGVSNLAVIASLDGVLVTDKIASVKVKEHVKSLDERVMYEERRWGWYKVLDYTKTDQGIDFLTKKIHVSAGKNISYQKHSFRSEVWTIISGEGQFVFEDKIHPVKPGDVLQIPIGAKHGIKASTDLEFIEVQAGSTLSESDIIRLFMSWKDIVDHCTHK